MKMAEGKGASKEPLTTPSQGRGCRELRRQRRRKCGWWWTCHPGREFHLGRAHSSCHLCARGKHPSAPKPALCVRTHSLGTVSWWEAMLQQCPRWEQLLSQPCPSSRNPQQGWHPAHRALTQPIQFMLSWSHSTEPTGQPSCPSLSRLSPWSSVGDGVQGGTERIREAGTAWISQALCSHFQNWAWE